MARKHTTYSDKFKAGAIALYEACQLDSQDAREKQVADHLGIPKNTLHTWIKKGLGPVEEEVVQEARQELKVIIENELHNIFNEMKAKRDTATYKDLTIAAGILTDKMQLLNDKPTQNVQQAIAFIRTGLSTIPEHLAPRAIEGRVGDETLERVGLRETVGQDSSGH